VRPEVHLRLVSLPGTAGCRERDKKNPGPSPGMCTAVSAGVLRQIVNWQRITSADSSHVLKARFGQILRLVLEHRN